MRGERRIVCPGEPSWNRLSIGNASRISLEGYSVTKHCERGDEYIGQQADTYKSKAGYEPAGRQNAARRGHRARLAA
jgi:hypothetical protein